MMGSRTSVGLTTGVGQQAKAMKQAAAELTRKYGKPSRAERIACTYTTHATAYANGTTISVPTATHHPA